LGKLVSSEKVQDLKLIQAQILIDFQLEDNKHKEEEGKRAGEKERCSGSYCQAVVFLVIKHDSISLFSGV
jgi:hypothetical protein